MRDDKNHELYYDEINNLKRFRSKIDTHAIYKEDLDYFSDEYEELITQAKVITRVSDRLQKKLDTANIKIKSQNDEIGDKNIELGKTVDQLMEAQVSKRASAIMLVVALFIFVLEQAFIDPMIQDAIKVPYLNYAALIPIFFLIKFAEGRLEKYFMDKKKKEIMESDKSEKEESAWD